MSEGPLSCQPHSIEGGNSRRLLTFADDDIDTENPQWEAFIQLFVVVVDTFLVWELLMLPSDSHAAPNLMSLRTPD